MANYPPYPYGGYPQMSQPVQMPQVAQQMPQSGFMGGNGLSSMSRPVSSREEAQACAADFSGALMVFPDLAHNHIYLKRWNMQTGAADFMTFAPEPEPPPQTAYEPPTGGYVPLQTYREDMDRLQKELAAIKKEVIGGE